MASSALNTTIESTFATAWASTTPIKYDNVDFTPVEGVSFVSLEVWDGVSTKASVGAGVQVRRTIGTTFVHVYTPLNGGSKPARDLADSIKTVFRDLQVGGITFEEGDVLRIGEKYYASSGTSVNGTGQWYEMIVAIPFRYDEFI